MTIVNVTASLLEQVEELEKRCFSLPWTWEMLMSQLPDDEHEFLAAVDESGKLLGYVGMMTVLDEGYISNVAVAEKARRQGIADTLLARLDTVAAEYALSFISLEVRESNLPAIQLYEKHGYEKTGMIPNCYTLPKENALVMTKTYH